VPSQHSVCTSGIVKFLGGESVEAELLSTDFSSPSTWDDSLDLFRDETEDPGTERDFVDFGSPRGVVGHRSSGVVGHTGGVDRSSGVVRGVDRSSGQHTLSDKYWLITKTQNKHKENNSARLPPDSVKPHLLFLCVKLEWSATKKQALKTARALKLRHNVFRSSRKQKFVESSKVRAHGGCVKIGQRIRWHRPVTKNEHVRSTKGRMKTKIVRMGWKETDIKYWNTVYNTKSTTQ